MMKAKYYDVDKLHDLRELVSRGKRKYGNSTAFKELDHIGEIHEYSFWNLNDDVVAFGTILLSMGLAGKHIALVGESSYSYVVSYLAIACGLGVVVPLDKELSLDEMALLVQKSDAEVILYSDDLLEDVEELKQICDLHTTINISNYKNRGKDPSYPILICQGKERIQGGDNAYIDLPIDPNEMSSILFTSGTTGSNKGVMLNHNNILSVLHSAFSMFDFKLVSFSVLPINHTYEFNLHVLGCIYGGMTLCFNDSLKHVKENLLKFRPEMSLMVPMIVESLYKNIWAEAKRTGLEKHLVYGIWFSNLIRKFGIDRREKFFQPVLEALGGNLKVIVCGGAPLRADIIKGFESLGISVYNGYGITECAPLISSNCTLKSIPGSVGLVIPDCKVRIEDTDADGIGEIQVQGQNVMLGYYKDEISTQKTFTEDGWFKTGDLGYLDKKGALYITGREKNLIILANGKNVHPEELEDYITANLSYVKEVVVYAPISPDGTDVMIIAEAYIEDEFLRTIGVDEAKKKFKEDVTRINRKLSTYKRIQEVLIRDCEFEKTCTRKIKRHLIEKEVPVNVKHY
ncbi:MAG: AMP-binding protein [Clostridium sp.]|nr:AMP-binding protein [Clostridium sp.]